MHIYRRVANGEDREEVSNHEEEVGGNHADQLRLVKHCFVLFYFMTSWSYPEGEERGGVLVVGVVAAVGRGCK
jgi:hypothetical protein